MLTTFDYVTWHLLKFTCCEKKVTILQIFTESQLVSRWSVRQGGALGPLRVGEVPVVAGVVRGVHENWLHGEREQILH